MAVLVRMHSYPHEPWASNQKWGVARCAFLCSSFSKFPTFYFCSDLHWTLVHLLKVVEKTQKICSVSRVLAFLTWDFFSNFAQWRYTNQWPFREMVLLLVENWIPIPRLRDVKYHLSCQFLMVLLQTNWSCSDQHCHLLLGHSDCFTSIVMSKTQNKRSSMFRRSESSERLHAQDVKLCLIIVVWMTSNLRQEIR